MAEGRASYDRGDYGQALLKFEEAVKTGAAGGDLFYRMGYCYKTVREDVESSRSYMEKAVPLLERKLAEPGGKDLRTYYYLASIYLSDLPAPDKLSRVAAEAISAVDSGGLKAPSGPEDHFLVGRLYGFQGKRDKATASYEKAIALIGQSPDPATRRIYLHCLEAAGGVAIEKQQWDKAADFFRRLAEADPSRREPRMLYPLCLFRAGKELEAAEVWGRSSETESDKPYLARIARRYVELGRPQVTAPGPDQELRSALIEAARKFAEARVPDDEAAKAAADKWVQEQVEARKARGKAAAGADDAITWNAPVPPHSAPRVEAEKRFVGLMAEMVRRGQPVREFAVTNGLAQLVFK